MLTPFLFLLRNHAFAMARHMLGKEITCAICLGTPIDPCYLGCNHGFCRECLDNWTAKSGNHECPMCRRPICFSLWYSVIDVGLGFLRIHCTYDVLYDVLYCFQWWTILHFLLFVWHGLFAYGWAIPRISCLTIFSLCSCRRECSASCSNVVSMVVLLSISYYVQAHHVYGCT